MCVELVVMDYSDIGAFDFCLKNSDSFMFGNVMCGGQEPCSGVIGLAQKFKWL